MIHFRIATGALLVFLLSTTATLAQQSTQVTSLQSIPSTSAAYVHFKPDALVKFGGMKFVNSLFSEVKTEVDELTTDHMGIRLSELVDFAFVVAPGETFQNNMDPMGTAVGIASFKNAIDPQNMVDVLDGQWKRFDAQGRKIYVDAESNMAILHFADNAIAFGSKRKLKWFIRQRTKNSSEAGKLSETFGLANEGQVLVGINGAAIPTEIKATIPFAFQGIAKADWAAIVLDLSSGTRIKQVASFASQSDAASCAKDLKNLVKTGEMMINSQISTLERQFANRDKKRFESAAIVLPQLAMSRYALKIINNVETKQTGNRLETEIHSEEFDTAPTVLICLAAVQAIGTSANEKFDMIAEELSQK